MSTGAGSGEIQESIYEDPDALLPDETHEDHPEAKPVPAPRFKLYQQTQHVSTNNHAESSYANGSTTTAATSSEYPLGYKRPQPVRPPPAPPAKTEKRTNVTEESGRSSNAWPPVKAPDINIIHPPHPPHHPPHHPPPPPPHPPPHPPPPHPPHPPPHPPPPRPAHFPGFPKHSDNRPCSASQRYETTSVCSRPSRPSATISTYLYVTPVSPARSQESLNITGTNCGTQKSPPPLPVNPPPLLSARKGSACSEIDHHYLEILPDNPDETDLSELLNWFNRMLSYSASLPLSLYGAGRDDTRSISQKATNAEKACHLYNHLMMKHKEDLQKIITDFRSICEQLNKMKKKHKAMGIAGGTTGAVGGVATVVGLALAPVTFGASLVVTAVGAGMIVSAGGLGAHAALASKKTVTRERVEKLVKDYKEGVTDLERCLDFILSMAMELQQHGIARLESTGAHPDAVRMAYKLHNVLSSMGVYARSGGMTSEKLLKAFTKEMDLFFTEKNGQKLKKSNKSIFSGKVSLLADGLKEGLDHLIEMWEKLS